MKAKYYRTKIEPDKLRRLHDCSDAQGFLRIIGHFSAQCLTGLVIFKCTEIG